MSARMTAKLALFAMIGLSPAWALAQDAKRPIPPNPAGGNWTQSVTKESAIVG